MQVKRLDKIKWNQRFTHVDAEIVSAPWASADGRAETMKELLI
jgi:hypothetical protein